ncbi:MAG: hypothetical protein ABSD96_15080 [Candidatus Korobacteraceae bacterium]
MSSLEKSPDGGGVGHTNRRTLLEGDLFSERMHLDFATQCLLGIGAAEASGHIDAVAGFAAFYAVTHAEDFARAIHPRCIWKRRLHGVSSGADVSLDGVYARSMNANDYLARAGTEIWSVFQDQLFRTAKLTNTYCFHGSPSLSRVGENRVCSNRSTGLGKSRDAARAILK